MSSAHQETAQRLHFGATGWVIDFVGCSEIVAGLRTVFRGWDLCTGPPSAFPGKPPRARISRTDFGWEWVEMGAPKARDWDTIPPRTAIRVITDVHDAAIYWYLAENPELLCLHGAAVRIGGSLVCFPARGRTGKSTLVACLAARGLDIFADDVLGLDGATGIGLGFLPRLRAPLAPTFSDATLGFIASHQGPADASWIYLDPGPRMAPFGSHAPITAFVLLERREDATPTLSPARTADVLRHLIAENIIRQLPMNVIFDRLHALALSAERHVLRYSDPQDAAQLLAERFG